MIIINSSTFPSLSLCIYNIEQIQIIYILYLIWNNIYIIVSCIFFTWSQHPLVSNYVFFSVFWRKEDSFSWLNCKLRRNKRSIPMRWKKGGNKKEKGRRIFGMCTSILHLLRLDCSLYVSMLRWSVKYLIN